MKLGVSYQGKTEVKGVPKQDAQEDFWHKSDGIIGDWLELQSDELQILQFLSNLSRVTKSRREG